MGISKSIGRWVTVFRTIGTHSQILSNLVDIYFESEPNDNKLQSWWGKMLLALNNKFYSVMLMSSESRNRVPRKTTDLRETLSALRVTVSICDFFLFAGQMHINFGHVHGVATHSLVLAVPGNRDVSGRGSQTLSQSCSWRQKMHKDQETNGCMWGVPDYAQPF